MIYTASDHGGFELKNTLIERLRRLNIEVTDKGPFDYQEDDDYPDYIFPVMRKLQDEPDNKAVLICRNGVGVCIAANKIKGIRAALSWNPKHAASTRTDDDTNVLCLPADYIDEDEAQKIVVTWLHTPFSGEDRHKRRINKIKMVEEL